MRKLKGVVVYDKNLRRMGKVIKEDSFSIYIEFPPLQGASPEYVVVTPGTFKTRFEFVDVETVGSESVKKPEKTGSIGDGKKLYKLLLSKIYYYLNTEITIAHTKANVLDIIYKTTKVLRVSIFSRKLVILADPSALSPEVYSKVSKIVTYGKLKAKFDVYYDKDVSMFLGNLVLDVMYKASLLEEEKNGKNY